jgi:hypothetical protein
MFTAIQAYKAPRGNVSAMRELIESYTRKVSLSNSCT